jgi:hypothetical protein
MALDSFEKQPWEEFRISADFGLNMQESETLVLGNCIVSAKDPDGQDVTATVTDQTTIAVVDGESSGVVSGAVQCLIKAGSDGVTYKLTFKGVSDLDHKWEKDINMKVKEQ